MLFGDNHDGCDSTSYRLAAAVTVVVVMTAEAAASAPPPHPPPCPPFLFVLLLLLGRRRVQVVSSAKDSTWSFSRALAVVLEIKTLCHLGLKRGKLKISS